MLNMTSFVRFQKLGVLCFFFIKQGFHGDKFHVRNTVYIVSKPFLLSQPLAASSPDRQVEGNRGILGSQDCTDHSAPRARKIPQALPWIISQLPISTNHFSMHLGQQPWINLICSLPELSTLTGLSEIFREHRAAAASPESALMVLGNKSLTKTRS